MLGGLAVLGWMIMKFGDAPVRLFTRDQLDVVFISDRAEGLSEGSTVSFRGVTVGKIMSIQRLADQENVRIEARVDLEPPLPGNVIAEIRSTGLIGAASRISLQVRPGDQPQGQLAQGQTIETHFVGLNLLPPEFTQLATELRLATQQFRESNIVGDLQTAVRQATITINSVNEIVADPQIKANLKDSLANVASATATANRIADNLETFSTQLHDIGQATSATIKQTQGAIAKIETHAGNLIDQINGRIVDAGKLLSTFQSIAGKIDTGNGTAGAFINDKRLYESLVLTSEQLNATIQDLHRLIEQWEQEGATLKLR